MKWKTHKPEPEPKDGDVRTITKFSLFPRKCVDGYTRWLEYVWVTEEFKDVIFYDCYECGWKEIEVTGVETYEEPFL